MPKQLSMQSRFAAEFAKSLQTELDSFCPEESWGGYLPGMDGEVQSVEVSDGNTITVVVMKGDRKVRYEARLIVVDWRKKKAKK